jgi:hypothetical protein
MKQALTYSLKVWLTVSIIAPALYTLWYNVSSSSAHYYHVSLLYDTCFMAFVFLIGGLAFSFPLFLLLWWSAWLVNRTSLSSSVKKVLLSLGAVILIALPIIILGHGDSELEYTMLLIYCGTGTVTSWLYQLQPVSTQVNTVNL